jgi:hypothetical protein
LSLLFLIALLLTRLTRSAHRPQIAALQSQLRVEDDEFARQMQREKEMQRYWALLVFCWLASRHRVTLD